MTQKDVASRLNVTDKAVSKWERGLSYPDISLLVPLSETLGVSVGDLLNGARSETVVAEGVGKDDASTMNAVLAYADHADNDRAKSVQNLSAIVLSVLAALSILTVAICGLAIPGSFNWSLIAISSIVFAWLVLFPLTKLGKRGVMGSLIALSVSIIPFLWILSLLISDASMLLPIGIPIAIIGTVYLWVDYALFWKLPERPLLASAWSVLLAIPLSFCINTVHSVLLSDPLVDTWDVLSFSIIGVVATVLFVADYLRQKSNQSE
jgi:transcriptional regulator with XRE-family HTH domain